MAASKREACGARVAMQAKTKRLYKQFVIYTLSINDIRD